MGPYAKAFGTWGRKKSLLWPQIYGKLRRADVSDRSRRAKSARPPPGIRSRSRVHAEEVLAAVRALFVTQEPAIVVRDCKNERFASAAQWAHADSGVSSRRRLGAAFQRLSPAMAAGLTKRILQRYCPRARLIFKHNLRKVAGAGGSIPIRNQKRVETTFWGFCFQKKGARNRDTVNAAEDQEQFP